MMPVAGRPSSNPGPRIHPIFKRKSCHTGWDLAAPTGTPVVAADNGSVATISRGGAYGNAVMLAHGGGMVTFYAHLSSVNVSVGQVVTKGQTVGGVGSTGWPLLIHWLRLSNKLDTCTLRSIHVQGIVTRCVAER